MPTLIREEAEVQYLRIFIKNDTDDVINVYRCFCAHYGAFSMGWITKVNQRVALKVPVWVFPLPPLTSCCFVTINEVISWIFWVGRVWGSSLPYWCYTLQSQLVREQLTTLLPPLAASLAVKLPVVGQVHYKLPVDVRMSRASFPDLGTGGTDVSVLAMIRLSILIIIILYIYSYTGIPCDLASAPHLLRSSYKHAGLHGRCLSHEHYHFGLIIHLANIKLFFPSNLECSVHGRCNGSRKD